MTRAAEIDAIGRMVEALEPLSDAVRFRALAYVVSWALGPADHPIASALYQESRYAAIREAIVGMGCAIRDMATQLEGTEQ